MKWTKDLSEIGRRAMTPHIIDAFRKSDDWVVDESISDDPENVHVWHRAGNFHISFKTDGATRSGSFWRARNNGITRFPKIVVNTSFIWTTAYGLVNKLEEEFVTFTTLPKDTRPKHIIAEEEAKKRRQLDAGRRRQRSGNNSISQPDFIREWLGVGSAFGDIENTRTMIGVPFGDIENTRTMIGAPSGVGKSDFSSLFERELAKYIDNKNKSQSDNET